MGYQEERDEKKRKNKESLKEVCVTLFNAGITSVDVHQEHIKLYEETDDWNACELSTGCLAHFVETTQVIVNNKEK